MLCQSKQSTIHHLNLMQIFWRISILVSLVLSLTSYTHAQIFDGYALYNEQNSNTAYLIDANGNIAHRWNCPTRGNYAVLMKDNGNIVRGAVNTSNQLNGAAVGGMLQEFDSLANVVWEFEYSTADYVSHHDITLLPNGNVLMIAWEVKSRDSLEARGYTGTSNSLYPTHIIEVQQNGTGGQVVWEWHIWDHLIQDVDPTKLNYGVVGDHPELMDINVPSTARGGGPGGGGGDWFHVNGIDYNAELDQIAFTSRYMREIFIIDHSTTTAEAASHSGGNAGKGGDFLFRWGNPSNYDATGARQIPAAVHDVRWIDSSANHQYGGYLQYFNNEGGAGGSSTVDAFLPPRTADGYNYAYVQGVGYEPVLSHQFRHDCRDDADGQSASNRLPNGNVFVNLSRGYMYEVDMNDNLVWQYNAGPAKAFRYTCDYPGIIQLLNDPCGVTTGIEDELRATNINIYPNPSTGLFYLNLGNATQIATLEKSQITDVQGRVVATFDGNTRSLDLSDQTPGMYFLTLDFGSDGIVTKKISRK